MVRLKLLRQNRIRGGKPPEPDLKTVMAMLGNGIQPPKPYLTPTPPKR